MARPRSSFLHTFAAAGLAVAVGVPLAATAAPDPGSPALQATARTTVVASESDLRREQAAVRRHRDAAQAAEQAAEQAAADPRTIARALLADRGQADQFSCLDRLWTSESDWRVTADNPTSSAYGIPQALPGSKMATAGADWRTNPRTQIRWGLDYIDASYGSPCSAWRFWQSHNWY